MRYSKDLRQRALQAVRKGHRKAEVREMFGLGVNTLRDWENLETETGSLENRPYIRSVHKDESGFDEYYSREYGYALRGEKVIGKISGKHFARTSIVAAKNGNLFEGWLEYVLIPALKTLRKVC